ncbi:AI-2E family transporter [Sideroxydans sp.]
MQKRFEQIAKLFAVFILVVGCFIVMRPFLVATLMAAVVCISSWPAYEWLLRRFNGHRNWAATSMTFALILVVILPLALVAYSLSDNVMSIYGYISEIVRSGPVEPPKWVAKLPLIGTSVHDYWHTLASNQKEMNALTDRILVPAKEMLIASGAVLGQGLIEMSLGTFICFYFYRYGVELMRFLDGVMDRVIGLQAQDISMIIVKTVRSVMYGLFGSSLAQGIVATIGFAIAGVPAALMLGFATAVIALVPIGPPLLWGGAVVWLLMQGDIGWAFFMLAWGVILISGIDNMVLPLIMSRGSDLPFIMLLLGVFGGVMAFGLVGVFIGPTLLAVGLSLLERWLARDEVTGQEPAT